MKRLAILLAATLLLASCGRWGAEKTKAAWAEVRLPAKVISGTETLDCYCVYWLIDAGGQLVEIEGYGLSFAPGKIIERPHP